MQKTTIQPYDASTDLEAVFALWESTVGSEWPLALERFQPVLAGENAHHFVAREGGQIVGFVGTMLEESSDEKIGSLLLLLVAPAWQGRGIGSALHETALAYLRSSDVRQVRLGGRNLRFWCGVPGNLPQGKGFFRGRGWGFNEGTVYDLTQDLRSYVSLPSVHQRMEAERVTLEPAREQDIADVLAFEAREFPHWLAHYELCAQLGDAGDLLVAREQSGRVVGTLVMYTAQSHPTRPDLIWQKLLGADAGAMGAVGVAEAERGRGIGLGLVVRGSDILKQRGVTSCLIDWVVLTDFYAKAGYAKWRSYDMSWLEL